MKSLMAVIALIPTFAFAGSVECTLIKNGSQTFKVEQMMVHQQDAEEGLEFYHGQADNKVKAVVTFLPYQDGIYASLRDAEFGTESMAIAEDFAVLSYKKRKDTYTLSCSRVK